jgi:hypothetical protein
MIESNPKQINSIYYAKDDPNKPKSYNRGYPVTKLSRKNGELMMIQGPLYPFFLSNKVTSLRCLGDVIDGEPPVTNKRVDFWVKTGIHIRGRDNWIIIKTHTHGASAGDAVLGEEMDNVFNYLEDKYNDGYEYVLHYVTARELYNIIKAIEAGEPGINPEDYRDYRITPPSYDSTPQVFEASTTLKTYIARTYRD